MIEPPKDWKEVSRCVFAPHVVGPASPLHLAAVADATADRDRGRRQAHVANSIAVAPPGSSICSRDRRPSAVNARSMSSPLW
jgi:hypothetical protein